MLRVLIGAVLSLAFAGFAVSSAECAVMDLKIIRAKKKQALEEAKTKSSPSAEA